eukprot:13044297-Ditylum_brightwellii.AAC.2
MDGDRVCHLCKLLEGVHDTLPLGTANMTQLLCGVFLTHSNDAFFCHGGWVRPETLEDLCVRESTCNGFGVRIDVARGGRGP